MDDSIFKHQIRYLYRMIDSADDIVIKKTMNHLSDRRNQQGGTLSGGEQQMLAISRAIMSKPKLLLLDEPSLGLAPIITKQIFNIIKKINQEYKTTIFLVEQNANLALKIADRGYVMETGTITMTGTGEKLLANEAVKRAYLGM